MSKGTIGKANSEAIFLNSRDNKRLLASFLWFGGGFLSHFPFLFAPIGIFLLNNNNYREILTGYVYGGELIWIAAVFLIITMGNSIIDFLNPSTKIGFKRMIFLCIGGFMFLICILVYFGGKGQEEPLSIATSVILWFLSMGISVVLYVDITKETRT